MIQSRLFYLFLLVLGCASLPAQIVLVGADANPFTSTLTNYRWDFATVNILDSLVDPSNSPGMGGPAFDAYRNRFCYQVDTNYHMAHFGLGTFTYAPIVQSLQNVEFDMSNGSMISTTDSMVYDSTAQLIGMYLRIDQHDVANGTQTRLTTLSGYQLLYDGIYTYDSNHGTYYILATDSAGHDRLLKVGTRPMLVIDTVPQLNPADNIVGMAYDNLHDVLYAMVLADSSGYYELMSIHPATGVKTFEASFPQLISFSRVGFDQNSSSYVFTGRDFSFITRFYAYHLPLDSLTVRAEPFPGVDGPQVDNAAFAASHYPPIGIREVAAEHLHVFPNPVTHTLHVADLRRAAAYEVLDLQGRVCARGKTTEEIPVGMLSDGLYSLRVVLPDGTLRAARFVKCAE